MYLKTDFEEVEQFICREEINILHLLKTSKSEIDEDFKKPCENCDEDE